jgi:hypothetical protein
MPDDAVFMMLEMFIGRYSPHVPLLSYSSRSLVNAERLSLTVTGVGSTICVELVQVVKAG